MMDCQQFDAFCDGLPSTFMAVQWGESHVWKVGNTTKNKVFAASTFWVSKNSEDGDGARNGQHGIVLKVAPMSFEMLSQEAGIAQAPYFPRGNWLRFTEGNPLSDAELGAYVEEAHRIMAKGLTKKLQAELGLTQWVASGRA